MGLSVLYRCTLTMTLLISDREGRIMFVIIAIIIFNKPLQSLSILANLKMIFTEFLIINLRCK